MATYKVLQDVEAEDKLIGPLTPRQAIYAGITAVNLYLAFFVTTHGLAVMNVIFVPIALVVGFFAFPWGRDQPTEVWALAKIRFLLKPRRRVWDQDGAKELVTVTAPKQVKQYTGSGMSEVEVKSRLRALADTIDSRGWVVKNNNLNLSTQLPTTLTSANEDRLTGPAALPQPVENLDIRAADDILDEQNNQSAQRLEGMIAKSTREHRQKIIEGLAQSEPEAPAAKADYWFLNQPAPSSIPNDMVTFNTQVVAPGATGYQTAAPAPANMADEANVLSELDQQKEKSAFGHLPTIQPMAAPAVATTAPAPTIALAATPAPVATPQPAEVPVTPQPRADILALAHNDDRNIDSIARQAGQNEVVIRLH